MEEGVYEIGHKEKSFCFDNEQGRHKVFLHAYQVQRLPVTNLEFMEFIEDGGYSNYNLWLADGWEWVRSKTVKAPLYWQYVDQEWKHFTLRGLLSLPLNDLVCHINFYEADAFARWKGARLLTEFEWETAVPFIIYGDRWEWTNSAYLPYPYFKKPAGAIGEYNGKFMINQMVLRGGSVASPPGHIRATYRNFFPPDKQWQYAGIRLARSM
jgi:formylglycine-generating enzyme required for sulfatase activity